jgi:hypothetical protein
VQLLRLHEETFLRNFYKKFRQEKRRVASRLALARRSLAAFPVREEHPNTHAGSTASFYELAGAGLMANNRAGRMPANESEVY